ncbi:PAS domain S-box protein [Singulisphaera acidiphila]|uniref:histidine kinase n=1 Tax=Singulisphaera acidiphila (strain ATCC BAA-1392 / DSM 18658 / VKM B-2454 / MOB10) TaxID=886293 RepID=L0DLD0_SINAD|nr:PAS domain S-box protein [Singulisphaera acidiphila]AGA29461.1 PAS domain S-box [Singulisphaera acidiphila DSM 18658]
MDSSPKVPAVTGASNAQGTAAATAGADPPSSPEPFSGENDKLTRGLGTLLARTSQPFAAVDFEGQLVSVNRAFVELTGYSAAELQTMTLADLTPELWHPSMIETLASVKATGKPTRYEKEYRRKDGRLVPIEALVDLDRDEHDVALGFYAFVTDISERKQVEVALRESEERFRRLYDEAPVGYHEVDVEGRIISINRTECEMLGVVREEVVAKSVFDFVAPEFREQARRGFPDKVRGDRPLKPIERTFEAHDGRRLTVSIEERFKRDEQGRVTGIRSTVQDITERKRTEAALVASERRARALFEGIEDAIWVHALDGRLLDANPAASRMLGYSREELLRMNTSDVDSPDFAAGFQERLERQMQQGHLSCEGRHRTKDGRVIPVDINTSTIQFDNQRAVLAVIRDITERKALEETRREFAESQMRNAREMQEKNLALTASEARYRQLTEGCLDAVVVADRQGRITLFNPAAEKIFGHSADEVLGRPITLLMPESFKNLDDRGFEAALESRQPSIVGRTVELKGRRKNEEEFPLELSLNAIELAGELQFIGSIRDQTERQRMRAMLAQSEKLASIGLLSAGVAHEINNPLAYVANNLAVLERDMKSVLEMIAIYERALVPMTLASPDLVKEVEAVAEELDWPYVRENLGRMLSRTREGVQRVANIVQNLRGLARTSPPKLEAAAIPDMLESALEMIRGRLRRHNIEISVEHGDVPRIPCVPSQISQVILNLLINATQAVEATGRTEGGHIRFSTARDGDMVCLSLSDNGGGIPAESLPQLFDPFFTTKSVGEGTGLGLSISHGIVTGHGGRIEVESPPGEDTCFRIYLPLNPS